MKKIGEMFGRLFDRALWAMIDWEKRRKARNWRMD